MDERWNLFKNIQEVQLPSTKNIKTTHKVIKYRTAAASICPFVVHWWLADRSKLNQLIRCVAGSLCPVTIATVLIWPTTCRRALWSILAWPSLTQKDMFVHTAPPLHNTKHTHTLAHGSDSSDYSMEQSLTEAQSQQSVRHSRYLITVKYSYVQRCHMVFMAHMGGCMFFISRFYLILSIWHQYSLLTSGHFFAKKHCI